ncbi:MAG: helix-turn-helix domain-containing protein [Eubacteriales bacterium]|nr:helix-turn-helix domain-containing protein [Eubacteriales bacterium]
MKLSDIRKEARKLPSSALSASQNQISDGIRELSRHSKDFHQGLEMDSRFVDTYQDISYANASVQMHSHTFYELLYCHSASGVEYLVGAERYKLQKGDLIFIPPGVSHCPILPAHMQEPYIRDVLWISEEFLNTVVDTFMDSNVGEPSAAMLLRTAGTRWEYIGSLFRSGVIEAQTQNTDWEAAVTANAILILAHIRRASRDPYSKPLKAEKPELLDQVLAYIEQHLSEKITLADVARHFFISESTITQTFRKKMGISFYRCVIQWRLIAAKALIEKGHPMDAVAEQVGFSDYSSFFRAFKQEYGISPRQYRKLQGVSSDTK